MKKIGKLWLVMVLAFNTMHAQDVVYDENVQKRNISSFHALETSAGIEVLISKGDKAELAVAVGDKGYLNDVVTEVENGVLKISRKSDWKFWNQWKNWRVKVYVSFTELNEIKASSGAVVKGNDLSLEKLKVRMSSGGTMNLTGTVQNIDIDVSSGAQFRGYSLRATNCKAEASSGGGIQITINKEINAEASSGGFINYKGEALIRDINVSSGGSVKKQN